MTEICEYHIDGRKLPAVVKRGTAPLTDAELLAALRTTACPLASADALGTLHVVEARVSDPLYSTAVPSLSPLVISELSDTPDTIHLSAQAVERIRATIGALKFGDAYVVVGRQSFCQNSAAEQLTVGVVLALVPWFAVGSFALNTATVPWSITVPNMLYNLLERRAQLALMRCQRIRPFMPFSDSNSSSSGNSNNNDDDDAAVAPATEPLEPLARQMLAFLLRWHQTRTALHPSLVKSGLRACDTAKVRRDNESLGADTLESWREAQLEAVLNNRSFVFFGRAAPRRALFESTRCWAALTHVVNTFLSPVLVTFVINELLDVMRFVVRTEVLAHGELAVYNFALDYLKRMCDGLAEAEREHKRVCAELAASQPVTSTAEARIAASLADLYRSHLERSLHEPLEMRVETIGELRARRDGALTSAEIDFLAASDELELDNVAPAERERFRANMESNVMCVSHNFFCGSELLSAALYAGERKENCATSDSMLMKRGRRYIMSRRALDLAVELTRAFLQLQSSADANGAAISPLESEFSLAAPRAAGLYSAADRSTAFDDVALGSDDFRDLRASLGADALRWFQSGAVHTLPLPAGFDMARRRGLSVPPEYLERALPRAGTLGSLRNGNVEVHRLALYGVTHVERCLKRRREPGTADTATSATTTPQLGRAHIEIDFDTNGDSGRRTERAAALERQLRPIETRAFADAEREAMQGRCQQLGDIEDIVGNMYANRALPLCARSLARKAVERRGVGYLQSEDRLLFYRLMRSFDAPEMTHEAVLRFLLPSMPANKIAELHKEHTAGWAKMLTKEHAKAADGYQRAMTANMRAVSLDEASAATTCAPSCSSMIDANNNRRGAAPRCPFRRLNDPELYDLLVEAGTDDDGIAEILENRNKAGLQCRLQFIHSRPVETRETPAFSPFTADTYFKHPHQYMLAAADHLLRHRENCAQTHE